MTGQRYRLKATKTKLYELVERHYGVPAKRQRAEFIKYPRSRDYALDFFHGGKKYHFFFAACAGKVILTRDVVDLCEDCPRSWDTVDIGLGELLELGLAEPMPARGLRETASQQ